MRSTPVISALLIAVMCQCSAPREKIPPPPSRTPSGKKIIIYQMMTGLFGNTNSTNKPFGTIIENGVGKMEDITDKALSGMKELGVTHVWYTGLLEHTLLTDYSAYGIPNDDADVVIKGRAGSPYAIKDYYDINPDLAVDVKNRMLEFDRLAQRTHNQGLKIIIDFVPNHVARGYKSDARPEGIQDLGETDDRSKTFAPNNNFYYIPGETFQVPKGLTPPPTFPPRDGNFKEFPAKATGNDRFTSTPGIDDWFETIKLNYGIDYLSGRKTYFDSIPDTWKKMRDILVFWAGKKVDGFRCDMAEMVPVEFWHWVIPQVKAVNPEIIFIAEIYNPKEYRNYINRGRFDYLYDKVQLYDTLRLLINGGALSTDVHHIQQSLAGINHNMLHFLENHDEQRIASPFFCTDPLKALPGMVVSATIDKGPVMIYFGQEVGEPGAGAEGFNTDNGRTTIFDYWGVPEHQKWVNGKKYDGGLLSDDQKKLRKVYADLLVWVKNSKAIALGDYFDLTWHNTGVKNISNRIVAFARVFEDEKILVIAGFNSKPEHVKIQLPGEILQAMRLGSISGKVMSDQLTPGFELTWNGDALDLDMPPFGYCILKFK